MCIIIFIFRAYHLDSYSVCSVCLHVGCYSHIKLALGSKKVIDLWCNVSVNQQPWCRRPTHNPGDVSVQWRKFARGCPWARDGWVPHWLRSACIKCKKIEARNAREPCGVGSRGKAPVHFNADTAFPTQTYIRQIVKDIIANKNKTL